jgi:hypothetical protein
MPRFVMLHNLLSAIGSVSGSQAKAIVSVVGGGSSGGIVGVGAAATDQDKSCRCAMDQVAVQTD